MFSNDLLLFCSDLGNQSTKVSQLHQKGEEIDTESAHEGLAKEKCLMGVGGLQQDPFEPQSPERKTGAPPPSWEPGPTEVQSPGLDRSPCIAETRPEV